MKTLTILFLLISLNALFAQVNLEQEKAEADLVIAKFASALKSELVKAMQNGGPKSAISICNTKAPSIAKEVSDSSEWKVARTSLKFRNPNNKPDSYENSILHNFNEQLSSGKPIKEIYSIEVKNDSIRYLKSIPTGSICLKCHGSNISDEVASSLKKLYPNDNATGYKKGEIRGAFTLLKVAH